MIKDNVKKKREEKIMEPRVFVLYQKNHLNFFRCWNSWETGKPDSPIPYYISGACEEKILPRMSDTIYGLGR